MSARVDCASIVFLALSSVAASERDHVRGHVAVPGSRAGGGSRLLLVPRQHATIQAAIDAASDGDIVLVAPGVYAGNGNRDLDLQGKRIVLRGEGGPEQVVIECQGSYPLPHRGFDFHSGEDAETVVVGFTVRNGDARSLEGGGGAALLDHSSPAFVDCRFISNTALSGGALYCEDSSPTLTGCRFEGNVADVGGGVYCSGFDAAPRLTKCEFFANHAGTGGGGMACGAFSFPVLTNCWFRENDSNRGGAMHCSSAAKPVIEDCLLEENLAGQGGAMYCDNFAIVDVERTTLIRNGTRGGGQGGALYVTNASNGTFRACLFEANDASSLGGNAGFGGAVYCEDSSPLFERNSFIANRALGLGSGPTGGAMHLRNGSPTLRDNVFRDNEATPGPDAYGSARGGAIYLEQANPRLGGPIGGGNTFTENRALLGSDLYKQGGPPVVDARSNTFTVFPPSTVLVFPLAGFDLTGGDGLHPAITTDVTISTSGVDAEGAPGPLRTLTFALSRMTPSAATPLTILVEPGTYSVATNGESFPLQVIDHVRLVGAGADQTILDAAHAERVLVCHALTDAEITGFALTGGAGFSGGGILCQAANPTIRANRIEGNGGIWGGGIACLAGSAPLIVENEIVGNATIYSPYFAILGGGIFCDASSPRIERNVIAGNSSHDYGGGIVCNNNANPLLLNDTFVANTADTGGGVVLWNNSHATLQNCIVWSNVGFSEPEISACCGSSATLGYTDVGGGWSGTGNLALDPLFVDAPGGDFHLAGGSPCIDTGDPTSALDPDGTRADMGALSVFQAIVSGRSRRR